MKLYPFRYFDPVRKRWCQARYVATPEEIAARYQQWEITGPPEIRSTVGAGTAGHVQRGRLPPQRIVAASSAPDLPTVDANEALLLRVFCRRYVV